MYLHLKPLTGNGVNANRKNSQLEIHELYKPSVRENNLYGENIKDGQHIRGSKCLSNGCINAPYHPRDF